MPTGCRPEIELESTPSHLGQEKPPGHFAETRYNGIESGSSVDAPLLAQLSALGFSVQQLLTLSRLSPEAQEEVYFSVAKLMMENDPVLDDILRIV